MDKQISYSTIICASALEQASHDVIAMYRVCVCVCVCVFVGSCLATKVIYRLREGGGSS